MKANFKPTLLASVIAAAVYAPQVIAAPLTDTPKTCGTNIPTNFSLFDNKAYTFADTTGPCVLNKAPTAGGHVYLNINEATAEFNTPVTMETPQVSSTTGKGKGTITVGVQANLTFNKDLTISDTKNTTNLKSARLLQNRVKTGSIETKPSVIIKEEDLGITLNGDANTLNISTDADPYFYTGAAIANYNRFSALGSGKTTIKNTGKVNGINQYLGRIQFDQELEINSSISEEQNTTNSSRQNAAILIAGGDATFNKVTIKDNKLGAGVNLESYSYSKMLSGWASGTDIIGNNSMPQATFTDELEIETKDGSAIQLTHGKFAHTGSPANINVTGGGHGIKVTEKAGGQLSDNSTVSSYNWIQLAGGTVSNTNQHELSIGLGKNAAITTADGDGINIANVPEGNINTIVIHNKGEIHAKSSNADADAIDLSAMDAPSKTTNPDLDGIRKITITNDKGSLLADSGHLLLGSAYNETFESTDGTLKGKINMGKGSDNVTITGSDISGVTLFDGGDDTEAGDTFIDTLTLNNVTYTDDGTKIIKWENITLGDKTTLNLTGNLTVGTGTEIITTEQASGLTINNGARLNVGTDAAPDVTIEGKVTNSGTIDLSANDSKPEQKLTIKGDYTGNNGTIIFDGLLKGDNNSQTDSLTIEGDTSGTTNVVVKPTNPGDTGEPTTNGIKLISVVSTKSANGHFTLKDSVQLTAFEYNVLEYNSTSNSFFLKSKKKPTSSGSGTYTSTTKPTYQPSKKTPDSVDTTPIPNGNGSGSYKPELYRPAVATYSMAQFSNQDAINSLLGDQLHQRVGEQEVLRWDDKDAHNNQVWGRIRHNQLKLNGEQQFEVKQNTQLVQFGWDLDVHRNDQNSRQHSGLFAGFARADAEVSDRDRAFTKYGAFSGKAKGDIFNVGGYHTRYDEQGNYLDVIGGVHFVGNRYSDVYGGNSKQKGWGLSASVEGGIPRPIGDSEHWFIEPQAQLSWQMTQYKKFDDAVASIDGYTSQSLRPRIGVRVGYNDKSVNPEQPSKDFYATVSFAHELLDPAVVNIGGVDVIEKVNDDSWMEVGIGGQLPIGKSTYIYGSAQYQHTIGSDARSGVNGQIGVRYSW